MFEEVNPHHALVDSEDDDVGEPEESVEERHVHVVVITIIGQTSVSIFQQDKPPYRIFSGNESFWVVLRNTKKGGGPPT